MTFENPETGESCKIRTVSGSKPYEISHPRGSKRFTGWRTVKRWLKSHGYTDIVETGSDYERAVQALGLTDKPTGKTKKLIL